MSTLSRDTLADWIECALLVRKTRPLGFDALYNYVARLTGGGPAEVGLAVKEMVRRAHVLGAGYPFEVVGDVAVRARPEAEVTPYAALLLLSSGGPVRQHLFAVPTPEMAIFFETLTSIAVAAMWGSAGKAVRFGWPSDVGRPPEFDQAVAWLAERTGTPVGAGYRQPRRKDGGVDVVAWRPFPDGRPGFPILLVQCTLQDNLVAKASDVDARLWGSWLSMDLDPVVALATPLTIRRGTVWDELALKGMVFERLRLAGLVPLDAFTSEDAVWCSTTVDALRDEMGDAESI